jgi:hypothetical protein
LKLLNWSLSPRPHRTDQLRQLGDVRDPGVSNVVTFEAKKLLDESVWIRESN